MDNAEEKDDNFPMLDGYLMIFGGSAANDSKRCQKVACCQVYMAQPPHLPSSSGRSPP